MYWWVRQYPVTDAAEEAGVARNMAIDVYQWLREVCYATLTVLCRMMNIFSHKVWICNVDTSIWVLVYSYIVCN